MKKLKVVGSFRSVAAIWVVALCLGAGVDAAQFDYVPPAPGSYELPVIRDAANISLLDSTKRPVQLRDLTREKITVISFIYTRCRDAGACPYASSVLNELHRRSVEEPSLARQLRLLSITFDPEHDTPARMAEYGALIRDDEGGCEWRFLTPRFSSDLSSLLISYDQAVDEAAAGAQNTGPLKHTLRVYLVDAEGRVRNIYSTGTLDARLVMGDVETLLMEQKKLRKQ